MRLLFYSLCVCAVGGVYLEASPVRRAECEGEGDVGRRDVRVLCDAVRPRLDWRACLVSGWGVWHAHGEVQYHARAVPQ